MFLKDSEISPEISRHAEGCSMSGSDASIYEFGDFRLETGKRLLLRKGAPVALTSKVFDTLLHLLQHQGKLVGKDELIRAVWPDSVVEENNLNQNISALR